MFWIKSYKNTIKKNQIRLKNTPRSTLESPFGIIEYSFTGESGPVVIISHGGAGGFDQGQISARSYLKGSYRVLCPSRFGHLGSELKGDNGVEKQAAAYAWLLDQLKIDKAFILGVSGGGPSALLFAQNQAHRCSGLILTAAVSQYLPARSKTVYQSDFIYWLITAKMKNLALRKIGVTRELEQKLTATEKEIISELFTSCHPISQRREGLYRDIEEWADKKKWQDLFHMERITAPALIIHGIDDTVIPYAHALQASRKIKNSELMTLADGGHLRLGHQKEIQDKISGFILSLVMV